MISVEIFQNFPVWSKTCFVTSSNDSLILKEFSSGLKKFYLILSCSRVSNIIKSNDRRIICLLQQTLPYSLLYLYPVYLFILSIFSKHYTYFVFHCSSSIMIRLVLDLLIWTQWPSTAVAWIVVWKQGSFQACSAEQGIRALRWTCNALQTPGLPGT